LVFDIEKAPPQLVTRTTTERFGGRGAVFRGSAQYFYRLAGGMVLRGQISHGTNLIEEIVATGIETQTWFDANTNTQSAIASGYYRIFNKYEWFFIKNNAHYPILLPNLEPGESLIDRCIRFSDSNFLIIRKTEKNGKEYAHLDLVENQSGTVLNSRQIDLASRPYFDTIHTIAYKQGVILIPTVDGLVAEHVATGAQRVLANTHSPDDRIWSFEDGILAVSGNHVVKIKNK
jgi:hypothetical protein